MGSTSAGVVISVWSEAALISVTTMRRMPRPLVIPLAIVAVMAVAFTAAAAPGGDSRAPSAAPQWPYSNWIIPTVAPDLTASATVVGAEQADVAKPAAPRKKAGRATTKVPYVAVPAALAASGIPEPAMRAYKNAARWAAANDPSCQLKWELLAAIGRVESGHGTTGESVMTWSGLSMPGIYGPKLDGRGPFALIRDTEDGRLDRDKVFDRAVGPMQFLPASWAVVGRDGDRDGKLRVHDIDDAAVGAAVYLCAGKIGTGTAEGLRSNIYRYNHSDSYVALVMGVMAEYGARVPKVVPAQKSVPKKKPSGTTTKAPSRPSAPKPAPSSSATPKPAPSPTSTPTTSASPTATPPPSDPPATTPDDPADTTTP